MENTGCKLEGRMHARMFLETWLTYNDLNPLTSSRSRSRVYSDRPEDLK